MSTSKTNQVKKPATAKKVVAKVVPAKTPAKATVKKTPVKKTPAKPRAKTTPKTKFPTGNEFWMNRAKHGREKLFATPELLWDAACEYFNYIKDNPLYETKVFQFQGRIVTKEVPIMRAMTMRELCFYLNCNEAYFRQFKARLPKDECDFSTIIEDIEAIVYTQKFQGAAGNLLNANIISRELGLIDKKEIETFDKTMTPEERDQKIKELLEKANQ